MVLRKLVAFIGLLGVIYALALQHGVFDRADAASPVPVADAPVTAQPQPQIQPKTEVKAGKKSHLKNQ